jgi:hypothetical protein
MIKASALVSTLVLAAGQAGAVEGDSSKTARGCPLALSAYAAAEGAVAVEFRGDGTRSFRLLVDGIDGTFDGFVFPGDDGTEDLAVVLDDCPEGDVTGTDLDACRIWQGPVSGVDTNGSPVVLPDADAAAAPGIRLDGLAQALSGSRPFRDAGLEPVSFETLALFACQD